MINRFEIVCCVLLPLNVCRLIMADWFPRLASLHQPATIFIQPGVNPAEHSQPGLTGLSVSDNARKGRRIRIILSVISLAFGVCLRCNSRNKSRFSLGHLAMMLTGTSYSGEDFRGLPPLPLTLSPVRNNKNTITPSLGEFISPRFF